MPNVSRDKLLPEELVEAWKRTGAKVVERVEAILRACGLGEHVIRGPGGGTSFDPEAFFTNLESAKAKPWGKASRSGKRRPAEEDKSEPDLQEVLLEIDGALTAAKGGAQGASPRGRGGGRGVRGRPRGRGAPAGRGVVAAPKPKAKSTAQSQAKAPRGGLKRKAEEMSDNGLVEEQVAPKPKAKTKARPKPKVCGQEEERILIDGPAAGWTVRGSVRIDGSSYLSYKAPHTTFWCNRAQVTAPPSITCSLEAEGRDILQGLRSALGCGPPPVVPGMGEVVPDGTPPLPRLPPVPEPAASPSAMGLGEAREIIRGPATGWVIRARVGQSNAINFSFRRPGGNRWETSNEAAGVMTKAAWDVVERERAAINERLQAKLDALLAGGDQSEAVPEERGARHDGQAASGSDRQQPQTEIMHVMSGIALGWSMRMMVSARGVQSWDFREPNGTRWRSMLSLKQGLVDPVICGALEAEQTAVASRFGRPLASGGRGRGKRRGTGAVQAPPAAAAPREPRPAQRRGQQDERMVEELQDSEQEEEAYGRGAVDGLQRSKLGPASKGQKAKASEGPFDASSDIGMAEPEMEPGAEY